MTGSRAWLRRHLTDPFVKEAKKQGYASRAAFKLLAIQEKDKIFKPGMTVVDLGAAPGGWLQVESQCVGVRGHIIAIDILPLEIMPPQVTFIQGDFHHQEVLDQLYATVGEKKVDVIVSDMAPNFSGQTCVDLPRSIYLLELALDAAPHILKPGGTFLFKAFQGEGIEAFLKTVKAVFKQVKYRKPEASRAESKEIYVLALGFK